MSEAGPTAEVTYRRAEEVDLPRVFAVFRAALNAYLVPAGQEGIPEDEVQSPVPGASWPATARQPGWPRQIVD